jgi:hypothetical protein
MNTAIEDMTFAKVRRGFIRALIDGLGGRLKPARLRAERPTPSADEKGMDELPRARSSIRAVGIAGLVLIPSAAVAFDAELDVAGSIVLAAGWLLALVPVLAIPLADRFGGTPQPHSRGGPTFIMVTAVAGVGIATEEPVAGLAVTYFALLWFYARFIL